ncbi:hypothetical protein JNB63_20685 [Microbacterium trichothecenolyticum]|uniref:hypothetical protein n=1 Tax=Microbacterium trichothecenolyticum TaxID=69370 RepID=UPI001C6EEB14|nr:hypothetical protein [Microbacterium trichothecenolyticum]MBW9122512.1 hypothetical protein [Microbacterium trichothecenolyticum]
MEQIETWSEFNVAMVGATAALAGLVIVAASVNIGDIIKEASLTARLAAGISGLVLALIGSAIGLIPDVGPVPYGVAMIIIAVGAGVFQVQATRRIFENRHPANRLRWLKSAVGFLAPLAYLVGGALLAGGQPVGLVWFAVGSIVAIVAALLVSWIVLVEVLR